MLACGIGLALSAVRRRHHALSMGDFMLKKTVAAATLALVACAEPSLREDSSASSTAAETSAETVVSLSPAKCAQPGEFVASGVNPSPAQVALDAYCGELVAKRSAPNGWVVMFGSSRLSDGTPEYANARSFATMWTQENNGLPVLTGGGPGLMEAGNRGARDANGPSLGLSTYFKAPTDTLNSFVTDGYMFSDFETRERAMLHYAKAAVIYWGGVGTAWELFMTLSNVQTKRMSKIPIILVGKDWTEATKPYFQFMKDKGTISASDLDLFTVVETPSETVAAIKSQLAL
jgi:uncharacterized protein (TIGR00730 family)